MTICLNKDNELYPGLRLVPRVVHNTTDLYQAIIMHHFFGGKIGVEPRVANQNLEVDSATPVPLLDRPLLKGSQQQNKAFGRHGSK